MPEVDATFEEHRPGLFRLAYRMLGSLADAEDLLQEAYIRWAREGRTPAHSPRAYLYATVTRLCIDQQRARQARREQYVGPWLPEPVVASPGSAAADSLERAETVSMALMVLLESLSAPERAAYLLRRVFDYDYAEIADVLEKSETSCRQLVSRAESRIQDRRPRFEPDRADADRIAEEFLHTCATGDLDGLTRLLSADAVLYTDGGGKTKAARVPIHGAGAIARFFLGILKKQPADLQSQRVLVNGQPGFLATSESHPVSVLTFSIEAGQIQEVYLVVNPEKLARVSVGSDEPE